LAARRWKTSATAVHSFHATNQSVELGSNVTFTVTVGDPSLMGNTVG